MLAGNRLAEFGLIDVEQVREVAFRQFHGHDDVAEVQPNLFHAHQMRMTQVAHADMAAQITQQTIPTADPTMLQTAIPVAGPAALAYINLIITKQALFIAYLDDFKLMMIVTFAVLPLLLFMKRGNKVGGGGPAVHMD